MSSAAKPFSCLLSVEHTGSAGGTKFAIANLPFELLGGAGKEADLLACAFCTNAAAYDPNHPGGRTIRDAIPRP
jgi:hypothetical protein